MWIKKEWNSLNNYKISTSGIGKWNKNMQCSANILSESRTAKLWKVSIWYCLPYIWCSRFGKLKLLGASLPTTKPGEEKKKRCIKTLEGSRIFPVPTLTTFFRLKKWWWKKDTVRGRSFIPLVSSFTVTKSWQARLQTTHRHEWKRIGPR